MLTYLSTKVQRLSSEFLSSLIINMCSNEMVHRESHTAMADILSYRCDVRYTDRSFLGRGRNLCYAKLFLYFLFFFFSVIMQQSSFTSTATFTFTAGHFFFGGGMKGLFCLFYLCCCNMGITAPQHACKINHYTRVNG